MKHVIQDIIEIVLMSAKTVMLPVILAMVLLIMIVLHAILINISSQENVCLLVRRETMEIQQQILAKPALTVVYHVLMEILVILVII